MTANGANLLSLLGISDNLPICAIGNDRDAVETDPVTFEKTRQQTQCDIGANAADEFAALDDRKHQRYDGISGIPVDPRPA
jgi:hypothetical protein